MGKHVASNKTDIIVVEKKQVWFVDVVILGDGRIEDKINMYQELKMEVERIWEKNALVVPVVLWGSLGLHQNNYRNLPY